LVEHPERRHFWPGRDHTDKEMRVALFSVHVTPQAGTVGFPDCMIFFSRRLSVFSCEKSLRKQDLLELPAFSDRLGI